MIGIAALKARLQALRERLAGSFFWVPTVFVVLMTVAGQLMVQLDATISSSPGDLPVSLTSTVESTRTLLAAIAGATISFAGVAFSVSLLTLQLASSQFSPRLIQQLFRDKFDKRVIGFVAGTFAYCLIVLRAIRSPVEEGGQAVIPSLSVAVGLLLGLGSILAVVAFINHSAHKMDINKLLGDLTERSLVVVEARCTPVLANDTDDAGSAPLAAAQSLPSHAGHTIRSSEAGWVQLIDIESVMLALQPGGVAVVWPAVGRFVNRGVRIATVWDPADDVDGGDDDLPLPDVINQAIIQGDRRTFDHDITYGLRQLVDIALKAMSPGVNDPTTAHEAINRAATVLLELLRSELPPREHFGDDGRRLVLGSQPSHAALVELTYDELRSITEGNPTVSGYILDTMAELVEVLESCDLHERAQLIRRQARLIGEGAEGSGMHPEDLESLHTAVERVERGQPGGPSLFGLDETPSGAAIIDT